MSQELPRGLVFPLFNRASTGNGDEQCPGQESKALNDGQVHSLIRHCSEIGKRDPTDKCRQGTNAFGAQQHKHAKPSNCIHRGNVDNPRNHGRQDGKDQGERVERSGVQSTKQGRTSVDERIEQRQVTRAQLLAGKHPEREVLNQIVANEGGMVDQRCQGKDDKRDDAEREECSTISPGEGPPPRRKVFVLDGVIVTRCHFASTN